MNQRLLLIFAGVTAAALAGGTSFGYRRAQLLAVHAPDSAQAAGARADSARGATQGGADSTALAGAPHQAGSPADSLPPADSVVRALGAADDPAGARRAAEAATTTAVAHAPAPERAPDVPDVAAPAAESAAAALAAAAAQPGAPAVPERRLAKIFGAMAPRDAARVLTQLDTRDVQLVLSYLNDRQAAAILAQLSPERAAEITGSTLRAARSTR